MRNKIAIALSFSLAACAGDAPPQIQYKPFPVPTPVPCVAAADIPAQPVALGPRPDNVSAALDLALAKLIEWKNYGAVADPLMQGCKR